MKRFVLLILAGLMLCSCGESVKDIKVTSFNIVSLVPTGLTDMDALVSLGIHNPSIGFEVSGMEGTLKLEGNPCLIVSSDRVVVDGHTDKEYRIPVSGKLASGFNPLTLLGLAKDMDLSKLALDVKLKVCLRGGVGKTLEYKDIPIEKFLRKKQEEAQ